MVVELGFNAVDIARHMRADNRYDGFDRRLRIIIKEERNTREERNVTGLDMGRPFCEERRGT